MSTSKKIDRHFLFQRASHLVALGFGSGLAPLAPGTAGTLWAWVAFLLITSLGVPASQDAIWAIIIGVSFALGCWACEKTGRDLGVADHGAMVWDEVVAFWLVLWLIPSGFGWQLSGFVLFRFFDMVKPQPIRWADQTVKGGFGVMLDDILAALMTLFVLAFFR